MTSYQTLQTFPIHITALLAVFRTCISSKSGSAHDTKHIQPMHFMRREYLLTMVHFVIREIYLENFPDELLQQYN